MPNTKLLLIGWDAADWQVIDPLMAAGKMPTLKKLIGQGVRGNIATLSPPLSPMLWTSIATGKRAYDHGIHGFVEMSPLSGEVLPVRSTTRKVKAIWNILNEAGLRTNVVNWWPSHPAEKLQGAVVTNQYHKDAPPYGTPWPLDQAAVSPERHLKKLEELRFHPAELSIQHILPFIPEAASLDPENDKVLKPLMRVLAHCVSVHNAATYLMENEDWDLMAVYYEAIDHFSHLAMKYHPPQLDGLDDREFELYHRIIEGAYRYHDMMLERLLELAGPDCGVLLLSDHGFQSSGLRELELPDLPAAPALEHRKYGVLAAHGPAFKQCEKIFGASLLDVTPTILHYFGLPVGQDMEGQVLNSLFKQAETPGDIPSWEITGNRPEFVEQQSHSSTEMLNQLEELGYIDLNQSDKASYVAQELNYNLCLSLLEGNRLEEAQRVSTAFFSEYGELRYGLLLAQVLLQSKKGDGLEDLLIELEQKFPRQLAIPYFKGLWALRTGDALKAVAHFAEMEKRGVVSIDLMIETGRALLISSKLVEAKTYFEKALQNDSACAPALSGRAQCHLELGHAESALEDLENSLEQQFFQPNAHYLMAQASNKLGFKDVAVKALKICLNQAPKHQAAKKLLVELGEPTTSIQEPIVVVTGFPRSGTSMMMKMLSKAELPLFEDGERRQDAHNPEGYFEHKKVRNLGLENKWVEEARGQVLKVVSPLLRYLPSSETYKLIWVKRPLTEVVVSQEVMKGKSADAVMKHFPFQMAMEMQQEEQRLENWIQMQPNMALMVVEYYDCLEKADEVVKDISEFLGRPLNHIEAEKAVNKKLHRNKLAT